MSADIDGFRGRYAFLSNFYFHNITWECPPPSADGEVIVYPTNEHAFAAAKTLDLGLRLKISKMTSPMDAKRFGRELVLRPDWDERVRYQVMAELVRAKFPVGGTLSTRLRDTVGATLIEGNTHHDNTWGDCRCGRPSCAAVGENRLGLTLMARRDELWEES